MLQAEFWILSTCISNTLVYILYISIMIRTLPTSFALLFSPSASSTVQCPSFGRGKKKAPSVTCPLGQRATGQWLGLYIVFIYLVYKCSRILSDSSLSPAKGTRGSTNGHGSASCICSHGFLHVPGPRFFWLHFSSALLLVFVCMFVEVSNSLE